MTIIEPNSAARGIVERAKNIILQPTEEFERIDQETPTTGSLYTGYALPLIVASAVASAIGGMVFGYGAVFVHWKLSPLAAVSQAVIAIVFGLIGVWLLAKIVDFLAPNFGGQKSDLKSTQVAVYAGTAAWVASLFGIFPPVGFLAILGLYSLYLLYRALPILMKAPQEKAGMYTGAVVVAAIVIGIVFSAIMTPITGMLAAGGIGAGGSPFAKHADPNATVSIPGVGEAKVGDIQDATKQLEALANSVKEGKDVPAIPVDTLKGLLPETLPGGFTRSEISTGSGGAMGFSGTAATGKYSKGDSTIEISIIDSGAAGALMSMASAFGVEATTENANGFEKTHVVDGRMVMESLDRSVNSAKYGVVAGQRVVINAEGMGVSFDEVKAAVAAVGVEKVEALAKAAPQG